MDILKRCFKKIRNVFEAYGDEASRETFNGELNCDAGKMFYMLPIGLVAWLYYIPTDWQLHDYPLMATFIRIGLTLLSAILIALKFTKRFRNCPSAMFIIVVLYINVGAAVLAGTAGENAATYISGLNIVFMINTFITTSVLAKTLCSILAFMLLFVVGAIYGLDFSSSTIQYSIQDTVTTLVLSTSFSYVLNGVKRLSWERSRQLKIASKTKSDFLARMSHEIRTPMNAITGMAELAMRENLPASAKEHIRTIKRAGSSLLAIINDILDLSKIESGKMEIVPEDYCIASLVNDVVTIINVRLGDSQVRFDVRVDETIPGMLTGDVVRIRQVLLNVLNNAVKFTSKGSITFSVDGEIVDNDTVVLTMKVADTGKGIKKEDVVKLFGEFVQVDTAGSKGIEGTGLGLAITKHLVKAMGGDVGVQSEYGKGSEFTITLPQKIKSHVPIALADIDEKRDAPSSTTFTAPSARILIVDDVPTNLKVAEGLLSPYGMQVTLCISGADAVEAVKAHHYDLIFMDHMMPDIDGIEATRRIRKLANFNSAYAHLKTVPIIALTANAVSGMRETFLQSGMNDFLAKPIDTLKLNAALKTWLPKEKQIAAIAVSKRDENIDIVIDGVDVKLGVKRTGGTIARYMQTLSIFLKDSTQTIADIKTALVESDTQAYVTHVHGLKSASANIGATAVSELAKRLEDAGSKNDFAIMSRETSILFDDLETLLRNIETALQNAKEKKSAEEKIDMSALVPALQELVKAIEDLEPVAISNAVKRLTPFENSADIGNSVSELLLCVLNGDYDSAENLARGIIEKMQANMN